MTPTITAVSLNPEHGFSKHPQPSITLLQGLGVQDDAHLGKTTQHVYFVRKDPTRPNLAQVHLIHAELHEELNATGFQISPGAMGENITTRGLDLMNLPTGTLLRLGPTALIEITGLREPCAQLNNLGPGLMKTLITRHPDGTITHKAGIMAIVRETGEVHPGDPIQITLPPLPHTPLEPV
jgi:MOSC domain-containing protein YiiM